MKVSRPLMGMPVHIEIVDAQATDADFEAVFDWLTYVDETFSTYKETSEISQLNQGAITREQCSDDVRFVLEQCEKTKQETEGFFDIELNGFLDPSGYVKGWAIQKAAELLEERGFRNFSVEIAGDMQLKGHNADDTNWRIGIRSPFNHDEIIKTLSVTDCGIATSGTAARGQHIYNPKEPGASLNEVVSITVVGPKIVDADRYATAAFAMGTAGIAFINTLPRFEGYSIDQNGLATFTPGFSSLVD